MFRDNKIFKIPRRYGPSRRGDEAWGLHSEGNQFESPTG